MVQHMMVSTSAGNSPTLTGMLTRAGHVLTTHLAEALAEIELTPRMQSVLVHALEQERTQIQLAEATDLDKTTMVLTIDALEETGYAERRQSTTDRRARVIAVTEAGERIAAAGQQIVDRVHADTLAALDPRQREAFVESLETLMRDRLSRPADSEYRVRRTRQKKNA